MPCNMDEINKIIKEDSSKLNQSYQTWPDDHIGGEGPIILALLIFIIVATIGLTVFVVNQI